MFIVAQSSGIESWLSLSGGIRALIYHIFNVPDYPHLPEDICMQSLAHAPVS